VLGNGHRRFLRLPHIEFCRHGQHRATPFYQKGSAQATERAEETLERFSFAHELSINRMAGGETHPGQCCKLNSKQESPRETASKKTASRVSENGVAHVLQRKMRPLAALSEICDDRSTYRHFKRYFVAALSGAAPGGRWLGWPPAGALGCPLGCFQGLRSRGASAKMPSECPICSGTHLS
jgi:hypothetical protein